MKRKEIKIGLFGFGVVGKGLYDVIQSTPGLKAEIVKIGVKDKNKIRPMSDDYFTFEKDDLLSNDSINVIVELIDDADAAFEIVSCALRNGKAVVSANKKMIAEHLEELIELQKQYQVPFLYEAACCASIPVIRNLEEYYDNDLLKSIEGIINGSTNYILTKMNQSQLSFEQALTEAQQLGYAESKPALDIEGIDAKNKLTILLAHSFGVLVHPGDVFHLGIQRIGKQEANYAKEKNLKIKLVAQAKKLNDRSVAAFVLPQFVNDENRLYQVDDVFNGITIEGCFADKQFFSGRGAGAYPTASAVLSDISALSYDYQYEYKKIAQKSGAQLSSDFLIDIYVRYPDKARFLEKDFEEIHERYSSKETNYLTGKISFGKLIESAWVHFHNVSIALMPYSDARSIHEPVDAEVPELVELAG